MKVLVANRGEIACPVLRTLGEQGISSVAVYSDVDRRAPHVWLADEAVALGEPRAYLDVERLLAAAAATGATAVHPGYGFLSENPGFAAACGAAGLTFIGPSPAAMRAFGDKRAARELAAEVGVPIIPGAQACDSAAEAQRRAEEVGYPVLLKAAAGGGGKGMRRVDAPGELPAAFASASREAEAAFADGRLLLERYISPARHVEVQILGDGRDAVALGERECSLQRRYQKVLEEAPSPSISAATREALLRDAVTLARAAGYSGAGTVEFLVGPDGQYYFLEVNARLQVEHPVTELLCGLDLVAQQIAIAHGGPLPAPPTPRGHAIEVRLNAEDPYNGFLPATGEVLFLDWPSWPGVRVDAGIAQGSVISPHYDSLIGKVIAWGPDREAARRKLQAYLRAACLVGLTTNQAFLVDLLGRDFFVRGQTFTTTLESESFEAPAPPPWAVAAGERALARPGAAAATGGRGDAYSPWRSLGPFRLARSKVAP